MSKKKAKNTSVRGSWTDASGRRHYVRAKDERELGAKIAEQKVKLNKGLVIVGDSTTVKVWSNEWLETYKKPVVGASWYNDMASYVSDINKSIGNMKLKSVKPVHIQQILNDNSELSASTVKKIRDILNGMFRTAQENGLIEYNPVAAVTMPKCKVAGKRRAITEKEREELLKVLPTHRHGLFCLIILYCGLRPAEVVALDWKHVDLKKKTIKVEYSLKRDGSIGEPKSAAGYRTVPIPDELIPYLHKGIGYVCVRDSGKHHTKTTVTRLWESICRQMDINMGAELYRNEIIKSMLADDLTMYCLRHTYCTDLQSAGVPINVARELMGHEDISTTAKIYTHFSQDSFDSAAEMINQYGSRANERAKTSDSVDN